MSAVMRPGTPLAATTMSARRVCAARSREPTGPVTEGERRTEKAECNIAGRRRLDDYSEEKASASSAKANE